MTNNLSYSTNSGVDSRKVGIALAIVRCAGAGDVQTTHWEHDTDPDLCLFPLMVPLLPVRSLYISLVASERAIPLVCPSSESRRLTFRLSV